MELMWTRISSSDKYYDENKIGRMGEKEKERMIWHLNDKQEPV